MRVREEVKRVACRAPSGLLSHCIPQTCASALTRNSAAAMEAVLLSTGTVTVTPTAKMAQTRRAVVSGPRPQAVGLGWSEGSVTWAEGQAEECMSSRQGEWVLKKQLLLD